jgi:hypothetical protein
LEAFYGFVPWQRIFEIFGTHYLSKTDLGGRMVLKDKMERTRYQELKAMSLDVKTTASLSFAKFSVDMSTETSTSTNQINAYDERKSSREEIYIGGK